MLLFMLYGQQVRVKPPWVWALQSHILAVPLILRTCPMCPVTPTSAGTGSVAWRPGTGRRWEAQVVFFDPSTLRGLKKKALLWAPKECGGEVRGASLGDPPASTSSATCGFGTIEAQHTLSYIHALRFHLFHR